MRGEDRSTPRRATARRRSLAVALATIAVSALLYGFHSSRFPLSEPDEARYAEMSREMLESGDWITPRLNYQPFLDKPPLLYWMGAASFRAFGLSPAAARLPAELPALAGLAATYALAASAYGPVAAALAVVFLATAPLYFGMAQILTMDMALAAAVTCALLGVWRGFVGRDRRWYLFAYLAVGIGILAKGPIALLLVALPSALLLARHGRQEDRRRALDPFGMLIATAVALPWFFAVEGRNPGFAADFLLRHHLQRFFEPWEHREPPWFYLYVLPLALFPWNALWLLAPRESRWRPARPWPPATFFLAAAAATTVAVFSVSRSKLIPYVLPALPPLAVLLARAHQTALTRAPVRMMQRCAVALAILGATLAAAGGSVRIWAHHPRAFLIAPHLLAGAVVLLCTAALVAVLRRRAPFAGLAAVAAGATALLIVAEQGRLLARDYSAIGETAADAVRPDGELLIYGGYLSSLGFYARRPIQVFPPDQPQALAQIWSSSPDALLVTSRAALEALGSSGAIAADHVVVAEENGKVLVAHFSDAGGIHVAQRTSAALPAR